MPIYLRNDTQPHHAVFGISKQYQEGKIEGTTSSDVRTIRALEAQILFGAGSYVISGATRSEHVLMFELSQDASVAPGMLQGAAGR